VTVVTQTAGHDRNTDFVIDFTKLDECGVALSLQAE
jgi:hypothetical protein